jgi:hypothetical protein
MGAVAAPGAGMPQPMPPSGGLPQPRPVDPKNPDAKMPDPKKVGGVAPGTGASYNSYLPVIPTAPTKFGN